MDKAILMSVLLASVAIPMIAARDRSVARGLKRTLFFFLVFVLLYVAVVTTFYVVRFVPEVW